MGEKEKGREKESYDVQQGLSTPNRPTDPPTSRQTGPTRHFQPCLLVYCITICKIMNQLLLLRTELRTRVRVFMPPTLLANMKLVLQGISTHYARLFFLSFFFVSLPVWIQCTVLQSYTCGEDKKRRALFSYLSFSVALLLLLLFTHSIITKEEGILPPQEGRKWAPLAFLTSAFFSPLFFLRAK